MASYLSVAAISAHLLCSDTEPRSASREVQLLLGCAIVGRRPWYVRQSDRMLLDKTWIGDLARLRALVRRVCHAEQRDCLLAVVKAIDGRETLATAGAVSRSLTPLQR